MIKETATMGTLDISEEQIYIFSKGIPGFEEETEFAVIEVEGGQFSYLQSLKTDSLSFLLTDPFLFYPEYEFEFPDKDAEELEIKDAFLVRAIVTVREQLEQSTVNLLAPIVLNPLNRTGKQIVLVKSQYQVRQRLWREVRDEAQKGGE
ncbi:flagellar assembly protein FliW [Paenibacillus typhae]|uniref:Flagellar assembly factor FliW n=1 Tax=Paenibacillus typhae TaxID=1174501 RepID=A0A1G8NCG6_9BACL|nr:flagellar assembly protein FliW [Paenibacillus typhae]SDI77757.1 flagellar assembly factor FliW [Paenibacillus typhae]